MRRIYPLIFLLCMAALAVYTVVTHEEYVIEQPLILSIESCSRPVASAGMQYFPELGDEQSVGGTAVMFSGTPLFVGNSLVCGLVSGSNAEVLSVCEVGISLPGLLRLLDATDANSMDFDFVVFEMGTNELGSYTPDEFVALYSEVLSYFAVPVVCLSLPPINEEVSHYDSTVNNGAIVEFNQKIFELCYTTDSWHFVDCGEFFGDVLDASWTGDGIHLTAAVYEEWYEWILNRLK